MTRLRVARLTGTSSKAHFTVTGNIDRLAVAGRIRSIAVTRRNDRVAISKSLLALLVAFSLLTTPVWAVPAPSLGTVVYANRAFLGFYLPAGEHQIVLQYRPASFLGGGIVSLLGALLVLGLALPHMSIPSSAITFFMSLQTSFFAAGFRRR